MAKRKPSPVGPIETYARDVASGKVIAGKLVRQACERHLRDLAEGAARGLKFDADAAQAAIDFFSLLKHSKGKWAGEQFELSPWQKFAIGCVFGWKRRDGTRRFRVAHIEVARKNGKTTLAAGVALLLLTIDRESGAEVYCVATKRDQAKLTHEDAEKMVKASPSLRRSVQVFKNNLSVASSNSKLVPLGADGDTLDGLNVSGAIMDELHAWKKRSLWDVIETATGARDQPLTLITTTAGYNKHSIWWERRDLACKVLDGVFQDDELFALIYTLDDDDDWTDEKVWGKGNPNLGVTVKVEEIRKRVEEAKQTPGKQNAVRRLRLNQPTEQASRWLDMEKWDACGVVKVAASSLLGRRCWGGLDLASTIDIAALVLAFPWDDETGFDLLPFFWIPKERIHHRVETDRVPYDRWVDEGWIIATPGNVIDYAFIRAFVLKVAEDYQLVDLGYDPWNATQLALQLQDDGIEVVQFRQGFASLSEPSKELEKLVVSGKLRHGGNPVLRWMASNVSVKQDPAGNLKPDKSTSTEKIDGIVGSIIAIGRATMSPNDTVSPSITFI